MQYCSDLYGSNVTHNAGPKMLPKLLRNTQNLNFEAKFGNFSALRGCNGLFRKVRCQIRQLVATP
jgi:hypothetical protein